MWNNGLIGGALIGIGYILNNKNIINSDTFSADEDVYMAEKLTKSKINYNSWMQGQQAMTKWGSYDAFLTHLATGATKRDTKERMMQIFDEDFAQELLMDDNLTYYIGDKQYSGNQIIEVWDLVEGGKIIASDLSGLMTPPMVDTLGRTYSDLMRKQNIPNYRSGQRGDAQWRGKGKIPHKKTGKPTSKRMDVQYRYNPNTKEVLALGTPGYDSGKDLYYDVRFKDGQRITVEEFKDLMQETMPILALENHNYNFQLMRNMQGDKGITDEVLSKTRADTMKLKSNRMNTLTSAERKLLHKTYENVYFNGGKNPITGLDQKARQFRIWDESKKYDGNTIATGGSIESIVYALKCSQVLPDVKTLRKTSNRRNAGYKPSNEAYVIDKTIPSYRRPQGIVIINNYDFMPHLATLEKWVRFNEVARATPQIQGRMELYSKRIEENQAIIDKYDSMDTEKEITVRVNALKQQLRGEYGLAREKAQAIERAQQEIKHTQVSLDREKQTLENLMNS